MAKFAGRGGSVKVGTTTVAEIKSWSLELSVDTIDVTSFSSGGWKEIIAGIKEWSGSAEGNWDMTDTQGQKALQDALLGGTTVTINLYIDSTKRYSGTAYIKSVSVEAAADDVVSVSFDFEGTGQLQYLTT